MNLYITLAELKALNPCKPGLRKLLRGIEYDKRYADENVRIPLELIYEVNGSADFHWVLCRRFTEYSTMDAIYNFPEYDRFLSAMSGSPEEHAAIKALCRNHQRRP